MDNAGCFDARLAAETFEEAAEAAMEEMKGKLATKYYCRAEEAWAMVDEWIKMYQENTKLQKKHENTKKAKREIQKNKMWN